MIVVVELPVVSGESKTHGHVLGFAKQQKLQLKDSKRKINIMFKGHRASQGERRKVQLSQIFRLTFSSYLQRKILVL